MPARNIVKTYIPNRIYHVYNRGVEKRQIFMDDEDYRAFLFSLKLYLSPLISNDELNTYAGGTLYKVPPVVKSQLNLHNEVYLLAFNLQPNHFHLQLKQITTTGMTKLMRRVCTRYSGYFNKKYNRTGKLFEGHYKAIPLDKPLDILYTSYYINLNDWFERDEDKRLLLKKSFSFNRLISSLNTTRSSLPYYLSNAQADWIKPQEVLDVLQKLPQRYGSYQNFLKAKLKDLDEILADKVLEE